MAETSRGRVTITLGRSGQVVKRAATLSEADYSDSVPNAGKKRSVRDRLGSNLDSSMIQGSHGHEKRQRRDGKIEDSTFYDAQDVRLGKDDLRLKLLRKNSYRRVHNDEQERTVDLREKLSRTVCPLGRSVHSHDARQSINSRDARQRMSEPKDVNIWRQISPRRAAGDSPCMDLPRNSYSVWTLDHIRQRSPERMMSTSQDLSPPRTVERIMSTPQGLSSSRNVRELDQRPVSRTYDDVKIHPYMGRDVHDAPRSVTSSTSFMAKHVLPPVSAKPATVPGQILPPNGIIQKSAFMGEEQQTVEGLLHSLGLGKYAILFKAEEVDMHALRQMGENDLKELGIPMGPRKKILLAVLARSRRQP
ncbi:hypothetical protein K2173_022052 [Erythroxylum novogranatense]|uniref:SAM domain-containing protein n=1 Tax=Erythroxylum novogranatense TaxID=1862640 RepID=A0AAV8T3Q8_9ROSI|nr:hypothetical protein K2173_022052 [Erythroxylum novogranatense]